MQKYLLLLLLFFPTIAFGQDYTGNYRAFFFNLFSEPRTITAEFEIKPDKSISAKVKVGYEIIIFNGEINKKGKFEAFTKKEGNTIYKLIGTIDKDHKISFIRRFEKRSSGNKNVSENGLQGTFAKIPKTENTVETTLISSSVELIDNG